MEHLSIARLTSFLFVPWQHSSLALTTTYSRGDLCSPPATSIGYHDPGALHTGVMTGLKGGVSYVYRVGDAGEEVRGKGSIEREGQINLCREENHH
jgi:hypothetical protein